ncbi:uncharacterized protein BCN122_II0840 [Burkholderia cenocepacia]|nr:uncharacterized protein BCN122_II0840 [Burkholderia cenocepacia]
MAGHSHRHRSSRDEADDPVAGMQHPAAGMCGQGWHGAARVVNNIC